jgi:multidrug resistance efflux pump
MVLRTAIPVICVAAAAVLVAHEGHNSEPGRPNYVQVERGGAVYRVGAVWLPPEPVVGEDVRFEFQFVQVQTAADSGLPERSGAGETVRFRLAAADHSSTVTREIEPNQTTGVAATRLSFDRSGAYVLTLATETTHGPVSATYTVAVAQGPIWPTTLVLDAAVLLACVGLVVTIWRRSRSDEGSPLVRAGIVAVAGLAALALAHLVVGPVLGRSFLPDRPDVAIRWDPPPTGELARATPPAAAPDSGESQPAADGRQAIPQAADVSATVIPAPGAIAEVVVPVTARVMLHPGVRLGSVVRSGAPLATLEHHYILHDAVHLINTRWPLLTEMLRARREMQATQLMALRLRGLQEQGTVPEWAAQLAQGSAAQARVEFSRAQKLLSMHDDQIRKQNLVRRPVEAPISGMIDQISLVQGQLAYENDPLFTIVDLSNLWIELRVPERLTGEWRPADRMTFVSAAVPGMPVQGALARVANQVDPASQTLAYFYRVSNPEKRLRVGMRMSPRLETTAMMAGRDRVEPAAFAPTTGSNEAPGASIRVTGLVRPKPELIAQATAPIWGRIEFKDRALNVGDPVKKDQVLANVILELSIDERYLMEARAEEIVAELQLARLRLTQAEQQQADAVARLKEAPDNALVKEEVQVAETMLRGARQDVQLLEQQNASYDRTMKIRDPRITPVPAPISGVITEVAFRPGELNATGDFRRLFTIVDPSRVWIEAQVFEHQSPMVLSRFKRASFTPASGGPEIPLGRPVTVSATVDPKTRTVRVIFEAANPGNRLKLGGSGQVTLEWN